MSQALDNALRALGEYRVSQAVAIGKEGERDGFSGALLLAIGWRETNLQNIINPAGTDRGWLQISATYHQAWLATVKGCPSGSWDPAPGRNAAEPGYVPQFSTAARYAVKLLRENYAAAVREGVKEEDRVAFAVAAYNAGQGGAIRGYREGDVDRYTTGDDYSREVLEFRTEVNGSKVFKAWSD